MRRIIISPPTSTSTTITIKINKDVLIFSVKTSYRFLYHTSHKFAEGAAALQLVLRGGETADVHRRQPFKLPFGVTEVEEGCCGAPHVVLFELPGDARPHEGAGRAARVSRATHSSGAARSVSKPASWSAPSSRPGMSKPRWMARDSRTAVRIRASVTY
jgi:hypothetical protein